MGEVLDSHVVLHLVARASVKDGKRVSVDELLDHVTTFV